MPSSEELVLLTTAVKAPPAGAQMVGDVDPKEIVRVVVLVRPNTPLAGTVDAFAARPLAERHHLTRQELAAKHGARAVDLDKVVQFALENGLTVTKLSSALRSVHLEGTAEAMSRAFGVTIKRYQEQEQTFRVLTDHVKVPKDLAGIVEAVVGFDTRPHARPHFRIAQAPARGFIPPELAKLYDFPPHADGSGQVIGIIELMAPHGSGFQLHELQQYFSSLGVPTPEIVMVSVDGGHNQPGTDPNDPKCADGQVMLDIEVTGAVAPNSKIVVYFAPNTAQGFLDVINHAVHDSDNNPSVISLGWGAAEDSSDPTTDQINQILQAAAALGITFCAASGDTGSRTNPNDPWHAAVDFPASSPFALGCGGTELEASGGGIIRETVWNDVDGGGSGGGVSRVFALPEYQRNVGMPSAINPPGPIGRGVPDVAGDAAPATGYQILVDGVRMTIGGTSAVAALWAGLVARLNQQLGRRVGFLNPVLYGEPNACRDIIRGANRDYEAGAGWDPCTGLGSPDGSRLLSVLGRPTAVAEAVYAPSMETKPARHVNVWLEDAQFPLFVGTQYRIGIDIGPFREDAVGGGVFREPDWGDRTELELVIALSGKGVIVEPAWQPAIVQRDGAMPEVYFEVEPLEAGGPQLHLSVFLARELTLLEKFVVSLWVVSSPAEVFR